MKSAAGSTNLLKIESTTTQLLFLSIIIFSLFRYLHDLSAIVKGSRFIDFSLYYVYADIVSKRINPFDPHIVVTIGGIQQTANYPPLFYVLIHPLTLLPFNLASFIWLLLNQLFILLACLLFFRINYKSFSLFNLAALIFIFANFHPVLDNTNLGQANAMILFLITLSLFLFTKRKVVFAALALALVVHIKIQFSLFLPILFLVGWRKFAAFSTAFILLGWAISWQIVGPTQNIEYFKYIYHFPSDLMVWPGNISLAANITRLLYETKLSQFSSLIIALVYLFLGSKFLRVIPKKPPVKQAHLIWALVILAILIFSPLLEIHHLVLCLLPISLLFLSNFKKPLNQMYLNVAVASIFLLGYSAFLDPTPKKVLGFQTLPIALRYIGLLGLFWLIAQQSTLSLGGKNRKTPPK